MTPTARFDQVATSSHRALKRAWALVGGVGVRTKILGIVLTLTVMLGLSVTLQVRTVMRRFFISELDDRGASGASDLAARSTDPILLNDNYALYQLLTDTVANHPDALYAYIVDPAGRVLVHTFGDTGFPLQLLDLQAELVTQGLSGSVIKTRYASNEGIVHDFAVPIFEGRSGVVHLGLTENRLQGVVNAVTGQMLLTTLAVAMFGILAAIFLTWLLTRPILDLVSATRRVGQGDLQVRSSHWANDEIGTLADAFNQMVSILSASQLALQEKEAARTRLLEQLITAQEEERKRIARELHDGVGQSLTSLIVGIKVASEEEDMLEMRRQSDLLRQFAGETLEQVRLISRQLRPSILDDLGLDAALERYVEEFGQMYPHIMVDIHCDLPSRLSPSVETTLYRIIQEAMTNAARHSGCATLGVLILLRNNQVLVIVEDDGCGFDPLRARKEGRSVGIHGMAERAELIGGQMEIESGESGTTVYVQVQIEDAQL
ncbi:MAG: HAMP domain-containing protein [Chloroflexi bacterium]|nr:HAMP domain-containing protein [Chloroflexota bacterium]